MQTDGVAKTQHSGGSRAGKIDPKPSPIFPQSSQHSTKQTSNDATQLMVAVVAIAAIAVANDAALASLWQEIRQHLEA